MVIWLSSRDAAMAPSNPTHITVTRSSGSPQPMLVSHRLRSRICVLASPIMTVNRETRMPSSTAASMPPRRSRTDLGCGTSGTPVVVQVSAQFFEKLGRNDAFRCQAVRGASHIPL